MSVKSEILGNAVFIDREIAQMLIALKALIPILITLANLAATLGSFLNFRGRHQEIMASLLRIESRLQGIERLIVEFSSRIRDRLDQIGKLLQDTYYWMVTKYMLIFDNTLYLIKITQAIARWTNFITEHILAINQNLRYLLDYLKLVESQLQRFITWTEEQIRWIIGTLKVIFGEIQGLRVWLKKEFDDLIKRIRDYFGIWEDRWAHYLWPWRKKWLEFEQRWEKRWLIIKSIPNIVSQILSYIQPGENSNYSLYVCPLDEVEKEEEEEEEEQQLPGEGEPA